MFSVSLVYLLAPYTLLYAKIRPILWLVYMVGLYTVSKVPYISKHSYQVLPSTEDVSVYFSDIFFLIN